MLLSNLQGAAIGLALLWLGVLGIFGRTALPWWGTAFVWAVLLGVFGWAIYSSRRDLAARLVTVNASLPDRTMFTTDGVRWVRQDGGDGLLPWSRFTGFREHGGVLSLDQAKRTAGVFISVRHLSDIERQQLRDFLMSHIPPSRRR